MIRLQKILVPTDLSDCSREALRHGCELAEKFGAELHVMHVLAPPLVGYAEASGAHYAKSYPEYEEEVRDGVATAMDALSTDPISDRSRVVHVIRAGTPFIEIIQYTRSENCDLIVMGTHGRTGLPHVLLGSVAERTVRKAPCPVLAVRPTAAADVVES